MTCKEVMTKDPVFCSPTDSAASVAKEMRARDIGSVPVCESRENRRVIGMVTDRDLALYVVAAERDAATTLVQEVMTRNPFTCQPEDDLERAVEIMQARQIRRVPVVGQRGELLGIIAQADIATRAEQAGKTADIIEEISKPVPARAA